MCSVVRNESAGVDLVTTQQRVCSWCVAGTSTQVRLSIAVLLVDERFSSLDFNLARNFVACVRCLQCAEGLVCPGGFGRQFPCLAPVRCCRSIGFVTLLMPDVVGCWLLLLSGSDAVPNADDRTLLFVCPCFHVFDCV